LWLEFQFPKRLQTITGVMATPRFMQACGVLLTAHKFTPREAEAVRGQHYPLLFETVDQMVMAPQPNHVNVDGVEECDAPPGWVVTGRTWLASAQQVAQVNDWAMTLDVQGKYLRHVAVPRPWGIMALKGGKSVEQAQRAFGRLSAAQQMEMQEQLRDEFEGPFLFCLALLHCRNVKAEAAPPTPPAILQRHGQGKIPHIAYKTLTIPGVRRPATEAATTHEQAAAGGQAEPKALHFVRGHFKDFSAHGLFGKYKQVYWWKDQVRGDATQGVVDKEYRVRKE
jgi:hypothetical protein